MQRSFKWIKPSCLMYVLAALSWNWHAGMNNINHNLRRHMKNVTELNESVQLSPRLLELYNTNLHSPAWFQTAYLLLRSNCLAIKVRNEPEFCLKNRVFDKTHYQFGGYAEKQNFWTTGSEILTYSSRCHPEASLDIENYWPIIEHITS